LLAWYEVVKKQRPGGKARFGAVCERLFGATNTRFIHNLAGNTQMMRHVRQVTKSVNPKTHANWTLERLYERMCEWASAGSWPSRRLHSPPGIRAGCFGWW
jgi:putative transposase